MQLTKQEMQSILNQYLTMFPKEREQLTPLFDFLETTQGDLYDRKNMDGHIVGSGVIIDPEKENTLLIYHNIFQRYQQPGGHIDTGETPLQGSQRECVEETGMTQLHYLPIDTIHRKIPIDIGCHIIPANEQKGEGEHWHFNFVYVFQTYEKTPKIAIEEVSDAKWVDLDVIGEIIPNIHHKIQLLH